MAETESNSGSGSSLRPLMSSCPNGLEYDQVMVLKVPLKSCIKQSNGCLLGSSLQEPLLAEEFKGSIMDHEGSNKAELCEDEEFKLADGENHAEEEEAENNDDDDDEDDDDKMNGRRRVRWVDGDGKDIAEVREFEDSDRDEDGCMQGGECRCVIQ